MTDVLSHLSAALKDHYAIEREIGSGGMATVYLAQDIKHDRDVAIKVLHPDLGATLGGNRFLSEIRTTAKLQHPHILPLLDSGAADGLLYYVMPYITGETLRERLEREQQLPINVAVSIAHEVADALGSAHALGIVHRDIKPENILLQGGHALVADFGIALAVQQAASSRMTQTGLSLGTPQYMSPEQAMGERTIDARSDIYSLGAVTYEMLTGEPPFSGPNVQAIVAKVMSERPTPLSLVRDTVPVEVENAVLKALAKLPADRFASAAEFSTALSADRAPEGPRAVAYTGGSSFAKSRASSAIAWVVAAGAITAAAWLWLRPERVEGPVTRVAVALPAGQELTPQWRGYSVALSRDGTRLAYVGTGPTRNTTQLWIRRLDELAASAVPNTIGASTVRWAPDGHALFFSNASTGVASAIVSLDGGQVTPIPDSYDGDVGLSGRVYVPGRGVIVRHTPGGAVDTVARIGKTSPITLTVFPDESAALVALAPDSNGVFADTRIVAVSLSTGKQTVVGPGIYAQYLSSGHLLYVSASGDAFVAPFDVGKLSITGAGKPIARVAFSSNSGRLYPQITVSDNGTLAYIDGEVQHHRLTWLNASGRMSQQLVSEGNFWGIALSPDGFRVAVALRHDDRAAGGKAGGVGDVWVEDLRTGMRTQLTSADFNVRPSWSPDGAYVLYTRIGGPFREALFERRADASQPERLVLSRAMFGGRSVGDGRWLPDHRTLIVRTYDEGRSHSRDIYYVVTGSDTTAHPVAVTPADETAAAPSPDGTLVAYNSDETGTQEVYVQPFPSGQGRLQVSHEGGGTPRWSHDGRSLYYLDKRNNLVVVTIQSRPALAATNVRDLGGDVVPVFASGNATNSFDVAPDGRILVAEPVTGAFTLVLVRNWMAPGAAH